MKTVVIYDSMGEKDIFFYVMEGDLSKFDRLYINSCDEDERLVEEWMNIEEDVGLGQGLNEFPVEAVKEGAKLL